MATTTSCPVCCDAFTKAVRAPVACSYCHYEACTTCYKTYLESTMLDAHCMSCRQSWSRQVLVDSFPRSWLSGPYKKHRETILLEREKQLLPETQELVRNYKLCKRLRDEIASNSDRVRVLRREINDLLDRTWDARRTMTRLELYGYRDIDDGGGGPSSQARRRPTFIVPCPVDECRGFLDAEMTCGVCGISACKGCAQVLVDARTHVCDESEKSSFQNIKQHTRSCPKCAAPTYKIEGCSQMWCTACHTTWDWNTGEVITGVIHNPHYFAYLRERSATGEIPRQPGDGGGGGGGGDDIHPYACRNNFPPAYSLHIRLGQDHADVSADRHSKIMGLVRNLIHTHTVVLPHLPTRYRNTDNADLRIKYLDNQIDETELRVHVQRREKKRDKDLAIRDIYEMACETSKDVLWRIVTEDIELHRGLEELEAVCEYANANLAKVRTQFNMTVAYL